MPRYYFDTQDGERDVDNTGVELSGHDEAVREGVRYAGSIISDEPSIVIGHEELVIGVRSEATTIARVLIAVVRTTKT